MPTTTYSTNNDLILAFGKENIDQWADVNNNNVYTDIQARLDWARAEAYDELNSRLASSPYQFPLDDTATPPHIVTRMEAYLAAILLYESRGIVDEDSKGEPAHRLAPFKKKVEQFIRDIHARRILLQNVTLKASAITPVTTAPDFVCFPDPSPADRPRAVRDNLIDFYP